MKLVTYRKILDELKTGKDPVLIAKSLRIDENILKQIDCQELVRSTTRNYHRIRLNSAKYSSAWKSGTPIAEIARKENFSPVQMAFLILNRRGITRRQFRNYLKDPDRIIDMRIREEIKDVLEIDNSYSPEAIKDQEKRASEGEQELEVWLRGMDTTFLCEREVKQEEFKKTPDCLLRCDFKFMDKRVCWIDSKASFGDPKQIGRDYEKQFKHYIELFGPGMVVYWNGYVEGIKKPGLLIVSREELN